MYWTNKTASLERLVNGVYNTIAGTFRFRRERTKPSSQTPYQHRLDHPEGIVWKMFSNPVDIHIWDRLTDVTTGEKFVVVDNKRTVDELWKHMEVLMRQLESDYHIDLVLKKLNSTQTNFDPILKEYTGAKATTDLPLRWIFWVSSKWQAKFVMHSQAGKIDDIAYHVVIEKPTVVDTTDRIFIEGTEYIITSISSKPFETVVGVEVSKDDSSYSPL